MAYFLPGLMPTFQLELLSNVLFLLVLVADLHLAPVHLQREAWVLAQPHGHAGVRMAVEKEAQPAALDRAQRKGTAGATGGDLGAGWDLVLCAAGADGPPAVGARQ